MSPPPTSTAINQINSAYREADGDPSWPPGFLGSSQDTQPPQPAPQPLPPSDLSLHSGSGEEGWSEAQSGCDGRYGHGRGHDWTRRGCEWGRRRAGGASGGVWRTAQLSDVGESIRPSRQTQHYRFLYGTTPILIRIRTACANRKLKKLY